MGTQEAESYAEEKYNLVVLKKHPIEWDKGEEKELAQFPYEKWQTACLWATEGGQKVNIGGQGQNNQL